MEVGTHCHKGEQVSTRCVNDSACKQLKNWRGHRAGCVMDASSSSLSYSIVWWMQAAQASYSGEAQQHCVVDASNPSLL